METDTIQDFIAYRENTILRMIPGFRILATMIPETFRSTTVTGNACRKTVTIQNTGIMSGFPTGRETGFGTPIMTPDGTPMTHRFPEFLVVGYPNSKASAGRGVKIYREMLPLIPIMGV